MTKLLTLYNPCLSNKDVIKRRGGWGGETVGGSGGLSEAQGLQTELKPRSESPVFPTDPQRMGA